MDDNGSPLVIVRLYHAFNSGMDSSFRPFFEGVKNHYFLKYLRFYKILRLSVNLDIIRDDSKMSFFWDCIKKNFPTIFLITQIYSINRGV